MPTPRIPNPRSRPAAPKPPKPPSTRVPPPVDASSAEAHRRLLSFIESCNAAGRPLSLTGGITAQSVGDAPPLSFADGLLPRTRGGAVALRCSAAIRPVIFYGYRRVGFAFPGTPGRAIFVGFRLTEPSYHEPHPHIDISSPPFFVLAYARSLAQQQKFLDEALEWINAEPTAPEAVPIPSRNRAPAADRAEPFAALDPIH